MHATVARRLMRDPTVVGRLLSIKPLRISAQTLYRQKVESLAYIFVMGFERLSFLQ